MSGERSARPGRAGFVEVEVEVEVDDGAVGTVMSGSDSEAFAAGFAAVEIPRA